MLDGRLSELVTDHAVGGLDAGRGLLVASLAALKPEVSGELSALEAAGAGLLAGAPAEKLPEGGLARLMAQLDVAVPAPPPAVAGFPAPLQAPVAAALARSGWRKVLPGIEQLSLNPVLPEAPGPVFLLKAAPGRQIPRHAHDGEEFTLVLAGGLRDGAAHYGVGDVAIGDPTRPHEPVAAPGETCICLVVADGAPAFTGLWGAASRGWQWIRARL